MINQVAGAGRAGDPAPAPVPVAVATGGAARGAVDEVKERRVDEAIRRAQASTATIVYETWSHRRVASGVVLNDQGEVLSVFLDPPADRQRPLIMVYDDSGTRHSAHWLGTDAETGLTLLRADSAHLKPIRLAAGDLALGADIFLASNHYGLGPTVTRGHVAGLNRQLNVRGQTIGGLILIQAQLHPGESGALLANLDGGWLGLVRGTLAVPAEGVGFAIPARDALWIADQLRGTGKVDRAYLGLRFASDFEADQQFAMAGVAPDGEADADQAGARVTGVVAGSPADRAGLRPNDRVVRVDDRPVLVADDLTGRLDRTVAGTTLMLEFARGSSRLQVKIPTVSRPTPTVVAKIPFLIARPGPSLPVASPAPGATDPPRGDDGLMTVVRELRARLEQVERRVTQLERRDRDRRGGPGP